MVLHGKQDTLMEVGLFLQFFSSKKQLLMLMLLINNMQFMILHTITSLSGGAIHAFVTGDK